MSRGKPRREDIVEVVEAAANGKRPEFTSPNWQKRPLLREIIEQCWSREPFLRPTMKVSPPCPILRHTAHHSPTLPSPAPHSLTHSLLSLSLSVSLLMGFGLHFGLQVVRKALQSVRDQLDASDYAPTTPKGPTEEAFSLDAFEGGCNCCVQ